MPHEEIALSRLRPGNSLRRRLSLGERSRDDQIGGLDNWFAGLDHRIAGSKGAMRRADAHLFAGLFPGGDLLIHAARFVFPSVHRAVQVGSRQILYRRRTTLSRYPITNANANATASCKAG